jgi:ubiquinone/menaquinone biosynthesis C-methylase UbiE
MPPADQKIYNKLAVVYSHLMRNIRYDLWAEYLYNISKKYVKKNVKVLELGAGSGLLTDPFRKYFSEIIATDISRMMLKEMKCKGKLVVSDMTKLPFKNRFELIFSAFDSVNYLLTKSKLSALFNEVERLLSPSGIFLFDVSLEKNSFKHAKIPYSKGVHKGVTYINKSEYDPRRRLHTNYFEVIEGNLAYYEIHKQKIYPFETYFKLLENNNLYAVECYDAFTFSEGNSECDRLQFVVKRTNG